MKVWALTWVVTDGCTYSNTIFNGVFESEEAAIGAAFKHWKDPNNEFCRPDSLDDYRFREITVGELVEF